MQAILLNRFYRYDGNKTVPARITFLKQIEFLILVTFKTSYYRPFTHKTISCHLNKTETLKTLKMTEK